MQPQLPTPLGASTPPPQEPSNNPYPVDYLNQIAAPVQPTGLSNKLLLLLIGAAILVIGIVGFIILSSGNSSTENMKLLSTKLHGLETIAGDAPKNLKNSSLRSVNSSLVLYLTNTNRDLDAILTRNKIKVNKKEAEASITKTTEALEEARLTDNFDKTYADEMKDQLRRVGVYMELVYNSTNNKADKAFLEKASDDLNVFYDELTDFGTPTS